MKKIIKTLSIRLFAISLLAFVATAATAADIEAGKIKATTCTGCHGIADYTNVYPTYKVPKIAGQNEAYLVSALLAYKNGNRNHATMQAQAQSLNQQDITDIAAWFASLK